MKTMMTASMMCADLGHLADQMDLLEKAGVDSFHIDVMDGTYVPNFGMGLQDIEYLCRNASIMTDIHLMIVNPKKYIEKFCQLKPDILYVHSDSEDDISESLKMIRENGVKSGLAVSPDVKLEDVEPLFPLCDYLLIMTVYPGFAGQKYQDFVDEKLQKILSLQDRYGYRVVIDGACSPKVIEEKKKMGVFGFVLGTSALFNKDRDFKEIVNELNAL